MTCVVSSEWVVGIGFREDCIDLAESDVVVVVVVIVVIVVIGADARIVETSVDVILHRKGAKAKGVSTVEIGYNQRVEG